MTDIDNGRKVIRPIAVEVLSVFEVVEAAARSQMTDAAALSVESFSTTNTFTSTALLENLQQMTGERVRSAQVLAREPAIARIRARDEAGLEHTYFISRVVPPTVAGSIVVSYGAPVGRMAALDIGDRITLENGEQLEIFSKLRLSPRKKEEWDSIDSRYVAEAHGPWTIPSLRALLSQSDDEVQDLLSAILDADTQSAAVIDGLRRALITKMGLRDQPLLDKIQDDVFRLPLSTRLALLGPPGTGKTTTLIRRLGRQSQAAHLDDSERAQVARIAAEGGYALAQSWIMFTPTRLLQQYVKDAFAREGVAAPERQIRTWVEHSRMLGRDVFKILRSPTGGGTFVLKEDVQIVDPTIMSDQVPWFLDFDAWQRSLFIRSMREAADSLAAAADPAVAMLAAGPISILSHASASTVEETVLQLARGSQVIRERVAELKQLTDTKLREALNLQLNRNSKFLHEMASFIDTLQSIPDADADDEDAEEVDVEETERDDDGMRQESPKTALGRAAQTYFTALRSHARTLARRRQPRKGSRTARTIDWIADRGLPRDVLDEIGAKLILQASARRLAQPVARYFWGLPRRYRTFRREKREGGAWYQLSGFGASDLHPVELDAVSLAILRASANLLQRSGVRASLNESVWQALRSIHDQMRIQVLVDEATDFSPIQLACMAALARAEVRSFFACGDFNQRLTLWGTKNEAELEWACPGIIARRISIGYRQTTQLNRFARDIVEQFGGDAEATQAPPDVDPAGVAPVLAEHLDGIEATASWIAHRVLEIARLVGQLPSIAVLMTNEAEVEAMTIALRNSLRNSNVSVEACKDGQAVGTGERVRVFDVRHIKGLEFEAVFFVDVDRLAQVEPGLIDKYLYVGSTRAATYLGLTCSDALPRSMTKLRHHFVDNWS